MFAAAALAAGLGRAVTTTYLPLLLDGVRSAPGLIGTVMLVNAAAGFAVPLVVGLWSDRLGGGRFGRRTPFIAGGTMLTAGGLAAVALGSGSSYLVLAAAGAVAYVGLNAVTTAHRALVPECFAPSGRARATSAQELALLVGGLVGIAAGGSLTAVAPWAPFALAALVVPLLAAPTVIRLRGPAAPPLDARAAPPLRHFLHASGRPGVGAFLLAQVLWVLGYAAMPVFFVLYAREVLALEPSVASLLLAGFGILTGAAVIGGGRVRRPELYKPLLTLGVVLLGLGFVAVAATDGLLVVGAGLAAAATGFGLISTLGFPLFSAHIPQGEEGGYTALYFSVRAFSSAIALPVAGWTIAATGSYRALFLFGGAVTLAALGPLARVAGVRSAAAPSRRRRLRAPSRGWLAGWAGALASLYGALLAVGLLLEHTALARADEALFRFVNAFGPGPGLLFAVLEEPVWNYLLLGGVALGAALVSRHAGIFRALAFVGLSAALAWGLLEAIYALYDRPRPSETFDRATIVLGYGHDWARIESFPSGHLAVVTALAAATWLVFPRLRLPLAGFVVLHAVTRVLFGAHFPLDVLAGVALGYGSARAMSALLGAAGLGLSRAQPRIARRMRSVSRIGRNELSWPS